MKIYVDNAATTKMSKAAIEAMLPYMAEEYGNPSSLHSVGQRANEALNDARARIAKLLNCEPREITFTSGGSEADNQAILSAAWMGARKGKKHIVSTAFEHHAVLHTLHGVATLEYHLCDIGIVETIDRRILQLYRLIPAALVVCRDNHSATKREGCTEQEARW